MFRRHSSEELTVEIDEETYHFAQPRDFEFALAGRTSVPAAKIASLVELPDAALLKEAEAIRKVEKRFADALSGMLEEVTSIGPFLKELDLTLISQDHQWRLIVSALNSMPRSFEAYKKVALVKYMQYLTARQEVVKTLYRTRQLREGASPAGGSTDLQRETVIFDLAGFSREQPRGGQFARIPKGETVEIEFDPMQKVELLLAKHRCAITLGEALTFVDDEGRDSQLPRGKTIVGRDAKSDIVISANYRDVSRKHLIVETDGEKLVRLTDISSHGTSVPPDYLENTSI
jgi:hypothetical protein